MNLPPGPDGRPARPLSRRPIWPALALLALLPCALATASAPECAGAPAPPDVGAPARRAAANLLTPMPGNYLRLGFLDEVRRHRSTLVRMDGEGLQGMQMIQVSERDGRTLLMYTWNFHEGDVPRCLQPDGQLRRDDGERDEHTARVVMRGRGRFDLVGEPALAGTYERCEDHETELRRATVAGHWQGPDGRPYTLAGDGQAHFPDMEFRYRVGVDHVLDPFDYLYSPDGGVFWKFAWDGPRLCLFRMIEDPGRSEVPEARAFVCLTALGA